MKNHTEIKDQKVIKSIADRSEYATLALCADNKPYSVPINFVCLQKSFYFHGAKTGRKMEMIKKNPVASMSIVEPFSYIPSYFSSGDELACPATQFFQSVIAEGEITIIEDYDEKVYALIKLMEKHQGEGGYRPLTEVVYNKFVHATCIFKLTPSTIKGKFKFAQHLSDEKYERIAKNLQRRGSERDLQTLKMMEQVRKN